MAKYLGRKVILKKDNTPIANVRTKSLSINRELVDSSDDDSGAWATHLDEPGQIDVSISVEGVIADHSILGEALNVATGNETYTLTYPDGGIVSGSFWAFILSRWRTPTTMSAPTLSRCAHPAKSPTPQHKAQPWQSLMTLSCRGRAYPTRYEAMTT